MRIASKFFGRIALFRLRDLKLFENRRDKHVLIGVMCVFLAFVVVTIIATKGILHDDSYITLRYAKNLVKYHQFTYNLDNPTYSLTTPLWALVVAGFGWVSHDFVVVSQVLSVVFALIAACLFYALSGCIVGSYALLPAVMFLLDPYLVGANQAGNESPLFSLLGILSIYLVVRLKNYRLFNAIAPALAFAMLILTRPEGIVILMIVVLFILISLQHRTGITFAAFLVLLTIVMLMPWLIFAALRFKTIIPTSVILKSFDSTKRLPFTDLISMQRFIVLIIRGYFPYLMVIAFAIGTLFSEWKKAIDWRGLLTPGRGTHAENPSLNSQSIQLLPPMLVFGMILFYLAELKEKAIAGRYLLTFSPYLMLLATQSIRALAGRFEGFKKRLAFIGAIIVCIVIFLNVAAVFSRSKRVSEGEAPRVDMGRWIARNISSTAVIANFGGAGGIAYYFDGQAWDYDLISTMGRDIELAKRMRQGYRPEAREYFYKKLDYIVINVGSKRFDEVGPVAYQNNAFKIIKVANKNKAFGNDR